MKKTVQINIGGYLFTIEEEAYHHLNHYLNSLKTYFSNYESCEEIIQDIEARIAEKFLEKPQGHTLIEKEDVDQIIATMGSVSDFEAVKEEEDLHTKNPRPSFEAPTKPGFYRDGIRKALGGVLAGIAHKYQFDVVWARMLFLVFTLGLIGEGIGPSLIILYVICWLIMPVRKDLEENPSVRKFYRNPDDKVIGGVASGMATFLRMDVKIVRFIFVVSALFAIGIILYLLLWILAPLARSVTQKLQLEGQPVTIQNIEKSVRNMESEQPTKNESTVSKILLFPFRVIGLFFTFLGRLLRPFGTFLKILAGLVFILVGVSTALASLVALGAYFGMLNSIHWIHPDDMGLTQLLAELPPLGGVFAFFAIFIPGLALIFSGIMMVINKPVGNKNFWLTLLLLWLTGILGAASVGTKYALNFSNRETVVTEHTFDIVKGDLLTFDAKTIDHEDRGRRQSIQLSATNLEKVYITKRAISNGPNAREAKRLAHNIKQEVTQEGAIIMIDNYFSVDEKDPFRDQEMKLEIEIPQNVPFRFTKRYLDAFGYPSQIKRNEFNVDPNGNNSFVIEAGDKIKCLDCPEIDPYENVEVDFDEKIFGDNFENGEHLAHQHSLAANTPFQKIHIQNGFQILIIRADSASVTAYSNDEEHLSNLNARLEGGQLSVRYTDPFKNHNSKVFLRITAPSLNAVHVENGAVLKMYGFESPSTTQLTVAENSMAAVQLNIHRLDLTVEEHSHVLLIGEIQDLKGKVTNKSLLKAKQTRVRTSQLNVDHSSVAEMGKVTSNRNESTVTAKRRSSL